MIANRNRLCVVTGALGGIGRAVTEAFAEAGWHVVGIDSRADAASDAEEVMKTDVSDPMAVSDAAEHVGRTYGPVDVLVNNAAIQVTKPLLLTSESEWQQTITTNLFGAFYCTRAFHSSLRETAGSIVNVASIHAIATSASMGAYAVSKAALVSLTKVTALELASDRIRCNAVLPGAVDTAMLRDGLTARVGDDGDPDLVEKLRRATPLGYIADAREIAPTILHLADKRKSPYTTGAVVVVDGGVTLRLASE